MASETDNRSEDLADRQHELPAAASSVGHADSQEEINPPRDTCSANLDRRNLGKIKGSPARVQHDHHVVPNRPTHAFEMMPIPAPAISRPTVRSLIRVNWVLLLSKMRRAAPTHAELPTTTIWRMIPNATKEIAAAKPPLRPV